MSNVSSFNVELDYELKRDAEILFENKYGITLDDALNILLSQVIINDGFPFELQYNAETKAAMLEAEHLLDNPDVKIFSDVEEALKELKS